MPDHDAVLVVTDAVVIAEIELVDFDLIAVADGHAVETFRMPEGHHLHALDHVLDAVLGSAARRTMNTKRLPAQHPRRERVQIRQVGVMIDVQVRQEDVVDPLDGNLHRHQVAMCSDSEVEKETLAVPQLDHNAGSRLRSSRRDGRAADKRNPHFVRPQFLHAGEETVGVLHRCSRPVITEAT